MLEVALQEAASEAKDQRPSQPEGASLVAATPSPLQDNRSQRLQDQKQASHKRPKQRMLEKNR